MPGGKRSEGFIDLPEDPFIDVNDDGVWDDGQTLGHPFELYIDENGNGVFDSTNGKWDGPDCQTAGCEKSKTIWIEGPMVFSGGPCFYHQPDASRIVYSAPSCEAVSSVFAGALVTGNTGTFTVIVGDVNLNALQGGTTITVTATIDPSIGQIVPASFTVPDGLSFGPTSFDFSVIGIIPPGIVTVEVKTPNGTTGKTSITVL
jgi:hypothetical protein